jgi:hypothetical protein
MFTGSALKSRRVLALTCALAIAAVGATLWGCSSSSTGSSDNGTTFKVNNPGDRMEVNLGSAPAGKFHFEAKGFVDKFISTTEGDAQYIYFWLYSGNNFYYKGDGQGFLYVPYEYCYTDYRCNYGKVKGRSNHPGEWPIEACYMDQKWSSTKWYSFDIEWDGTNISIYVDGVLKNTSNYGSNSLPLIAGLGWPPAAVEEPGIVGMEFRNWKFTKK